MKAILIIAIAVLLAGTLGVNVVQAQKTSAAFDQATNFSNYKTFNFAEGNAVRNPYVNQMIQVAVAKELTARGLTKVDANPDLLVSYMTAVGFNMQVNDVSFGYAVSPVYNGMVPSGTAMMEITTGTMLLDLSERETKKIVFRATAKDVIQRMPSTDPAADAKLVSKTINKSISKIFKKYPVKAGK